MSHAVVLVLIRNGQSVEELMAPYDENLEVEPYRRKCWCVGYKAQNEARNRGEEEFSIEDLRKKLEKICPLPPGRKDAWELDDREEEVREEMWTALLAPRQLLEKRLTEAHPLHQKPDPKCEECLGKGTNESTYNPKSKWDWFAEGGRWPRMLNGKNREKVSKLEVTDKSTPLAVLTPDGEWIEKGEFGWWGVVRDPKKQDDWQAQVREIFKKFSDATAVAIDYHI